MRYHTRQKVRRGATLAAQRVAHGVWPRSWRIRRFLSTAIAWERIGVQSGDCKGLVDYSNRRKFERFGFFLSRDDLRWYRETDPFGSQQGILRSADEICRREFRIGGIPVRYRGNGVDWCADPITGSRFPEGLFSTRPDPLVDSRCRLELNLHRHFPVLALASNISGDDRYVRELLDQWFDWLEMNPPIDDPFLNDGLELTIRVLNWTYALFLTGDRITDELRYITILSRIERYGCLIERNYSLATTPNNHQIAEAFGLFFIGLMYPEFSAAPRWVEFGRMRLINQLDRQFLPEGVHREQSTSYHLFVLECLELASLLARVNLVELPERCLSTVRKASEYIAHLMKPNGMLPMIGDTGVRFFSFGGSSEIDPSLALSMAAAIFADFPATCGAVSSLDEIFLVVGRSGLRRLDEAAVENAAEEEPRVFAHDGQVVIRCGTGREEDYLCFDAGPQGLGAVAGHSHDDVLSFEYSACGQSFVVDPGTYTYVRSNPLREYFAMARGHNGIIVDGRGAALMGDGPFGWSTTVDGELLPDSLTKDICWVSGRHYGYFDRCDGAVVERSLLVVPHQYTLVIDRVSGSASHRIENVFHFHPDVEIAVSDEGASCLGPIAQLRMSSVANASTSWSIHRGRDDVQPGWYSERYGSVVEASVLRLSVESELPFWRVTGLFAGRGAALPDGVLRSSAAAGLRGSAMVEIDRGGKAGPDVLAIDVLPTSPSGEPRGAMRFTYHCGTAFREFLFPPTLECGGQPLVAENGRDLGL